MARLVQQYSQPRSAPLNHSDPVIEGSLGLSDLTRKGSVVFGINYNLFTILQSEILAIFRAYSLSISEYLLLKL